MEDRISVIIPTLNEEKTIENCIFYLMKQTEKPDEIIIIDNGSTDNTLRILKNLEKKLKSKINLRVFCYQKGNQTNARDFGIKKARYDIIASLDSDALADKNWISTIKSYFKNPKIIGIGGKSRFRNKGKIFNFFYSMNYYLRILIRLYCLGGGNCAFRKQAFIDVNGYEGIEKLRKEKNILYAKDDYFLSKKIEKLGKLKFCKNLNVSLLYRQRNNQKYKSISLKDIFQKIYLEIVYDYKISSYVRNINLN